MRTIELPRAELATGQQINVQWISGVNRGCGQGGKIAKIDGNTLTLTVPCGEVEVTLTDETIVVQELPHEAQECMEYGEDCGGPVDYRSVGRSASWLRCEAHYERRLASYENSMERYADSDVVPDWFDSSYAGESWDED